MGQICAKLRNPDYARQVEENIRSPFHQLDAIKLPDYPERQLKFYRDIDDKFSVFNEILLSDFMTLLNNLSINNTGNNRNIKLDKLTKDEWKKFCENKILKNPIVKKVKPELLGYQTQFFDDLADDVKLFYAIQNGFDTKDDLEIPKSAFFSVGFNYCYPKLSQKVLILLSLFTDSNNKIGLTDEMFLFLMLLFSNVFKTPVRFIEKVLGPNVPMESILYNIRFDEADEIIRINELIMREIVVTLGTQLVKDLFGEDNARVYSREEFKKVLLEENFIWIFSNKGIKMKVEEELTRRNIGVGKSGLSSS